MGRNIKGLGHRVLVAAGLERSGRARELRESLSRAEERVAQLKQMLEQTRAEAKSWKEKAHEGANQREHRHRAEQERYQAKATKLDERLRKEVARLERREQERATKVEELREKIAAADRSVRAGRDTLMAIEVKLDVVEGAINVLDRRFRNQGPPTQTAIRRDI